MDIKNLFPQKSLPPKLNSCHTSLRHGDLVFCPSVHPSVKICYHPSNSPTVQVDFSLAITAAIIKPLKLHGGGRVERRCWVNFQCRGVLLVWMIVGQGPVALAVGAGGGCLDIFLSSIFSVFFLALFGRWPDID